MINFNKLIDKAIDLIDLPKGRCKHFTFILRRNKIVSIGWNKGFKTHPDAKAIGYKFDNIHSELNALQNLHYYDRLEIRKCVFVNIRLNSLREVNISKPCLICEPWLRQLGPKALYYSTKNGSFAQW